MINIYVILLTCFVVLFTETASQLNDGKGVCHRVEVKTITRVIQTEVVIGTTQVPCTILSFLDELACMNRPIQTRNVTELQNSTVEEKIPTVIRYCCHGYTLVRDVCSLITTTTTTTTTPTTTTTTPKTTTTTPTTTTTTPTTTTTTPSTTTTTPTTTTTTTTTTTPTTTTTAPTTTTTTPPPPTTTTTTTTPTTNTPSAEQNTEATDINTTTNNNITLEMLVTETATRNVNNPTFRNTNNNGSQDDISLKDVLLYATAGCTIVMMLVIGLCYKNSRRYKRRSHDTEIAMETVRMNGMNYNICGITNNPTPVTYSDQRTTNQCTPMTSFSPRGPPESIFSARSQNFQNEYTEMGMVGRNTSRVESCASVEYHDLLGFEHEEYVSNPTALSRQLPEGNASTKRQNVQDDYTNLLVPGPHNCGSESSCSGEYDELNLLLEEPCSVYEELPDRDDVTDTFK